MGRLEGKVALISGGARGLGAAHVELFAEEGGAVVFGDVLVDEGAALADRLGERGLHVQFLKLDVTQADDWAAAVDLAVNLHGRLTTLVNNAAIFSADGTQDVTQETFRHVLSVNLEGQWLGMRAALPALVEFGNSSIVNICSVYAHLATPDAVAYHASKGGVLIMTRSTALEYVGRGVRVNAVNPGAIDTLFAGSATPDAGAISSVVPLGRSADPREIAHASLFLASDDASYITGTEIVADGGWSAG
ncbi:SDR family NAD(P)-dependent oxidoreductase [Nocardioides immobilis]|uniref:SDR family NAD(P)-dependent oxidoreductase n=1 Tax=Nocardioides immobilis TaxID=2049295 RepID=UPI0015FD27E1|nr:SDR family oxidoreductase [Nocardioides immobilis]